MALSETQLLEERNNIIKAYKSLVSSCMDFTSKEDRKLIRKAFDYSMEAHKDARRKSGEPYIFHPIAVAKIVAKEIGLGTTSVICALLHDVVEDTFAELEDIEREFGTTAAVIIDGLTKISGVFEPGTSAQAENFRKMLLTLSNDIRVVLIKLADRLHNMRTLDSMKKESQLKIASETQFLYAPLAHRLGLYNIKSELEDLSLKYTEPKVFKEISQKIKEEQHDSQKYIQNFIRLLKEDLQVSGLKAEIKGRFKSNSSIYRKMRTQGIPLEEVFDLFALRIIIEDSPHDQEKINCWRVFSIITEKFKPMPQRLRDWITFPKSNGYESLHTTVMGPQGRWVEIQIRTRRMDDQAEKGYSAHWKYKDGKDFQDKAFEDWLLKIRELLENKNINAITFLNEFKSNLFTEEVYAFTPKGDLIKLPVHSTVLDFAYEIHTNLGNSCIGAKVNHKVVPLSHELQNGDQVEIITSSKISVKPEWIEFAKTSKAINKIKESLKEERKNIIQKGKEVFEWKLSHLGIDQSHPVIKTMLSTFKISNISEFYYRLGNHRLPIKDLLDFIEKNKDNLKNPTALKEGNTTVKDSKTFDNFIREARGIGSDMLVVGEDTDLIDHTIAECCSPIPGDNIIGIIEPDLGIILHRTNCPKAMGMMSSFGNRIIKAKWTEKDDITFLSAIRITGEDRIGMMNNLIKVISMNMKINIRSITIDTEEGMYDGIFRLFVHNAEELEKVQNNLRKVPGVLTVGRLDLNTSIVQDFMQ